MTEDPKSVSRASLTLGKGLESSAGEVMKNLAETGQFDRDQYVEPI